ncbi:MAG TPA: NAD(P)/FAD-dependent oxidoreductase [Actinomycetota bacterium]|nr:NAD(P)/FAD-dependent oxidoreductase [Actinomycetota bacterium]
MRNPVSSPSLAPRVAVLGAGFAGLSAALRLTESGARVVVLDARDRVGGRVWSTRLPNGEIAELGAEWIEDEESSVRDLARSLGLALAPTGVDYRRREARGSAAATLDEQEEALAAGRREVEALDPDDLVRGTLGPFIRGLPVGEAARTTLLARLQGTCARDLDQVALRVAARGTFSGGSGRYLRVATGNQEIAIRAAERLPDLRLRHVGHQIRQTADIVLIEGESDAGPFRLDADAAVVAVPAPLVAAIRFEPGLPEETRRAVRELPMGVASKLTVGTRDSPIPRALQDVDVPFWCWAALGSDGTPRRALTAFAGSPAAQERLRTEAGDPDPWLARVAGLCPDVELFGDPLMVAWGTDPFARGCYSAFDNASWDRMDVFTRPAGRIAFAGEHTAGLAAGTMDGAVKSGWRAAADVVDLLAKSG